MFTRINIVAIKAARDILLASISFEAVDSVVLFVVFVPFVVLVSTSHVFKLVSNS